MCYARSDLPYKHMESHLLSYVRPLSPLHVLLPPPDLSRSPHPPTSPERHGIRKTLHTVPEGRGAKKPCILL